jgi:hypothetical protein
VDLKWWAVIVVGVAALMVAIAAATLLPMTRIDRVLRPLAHVGRLTRLPEYTRVYRVYFLSVIVAGVLLLATFLFALTATARPSGWASAERAFDGVYPEDIMLCVGEQASDPTTAGFFNYFAGQGGSLGGSADSARIGLTSASLRVIPLTRDHRYVTDRLGSLAKLARIQQDLDTGKPVSDLDRAELELGVSGFSRSVNYVDYAPSATDVLALCMTGFPSYQDRSGHRRQLIYLGYSTFKDQADERASLYSVEEAKKLAEQSSVQINVIVRSDVALSSTTDIDALRDIANTTGGRFALYNPAGTAASDAGTDPTLSSQLDQIRRSPPTVELPGNKILTSRSVDSPETLLIGAVVAVALLAVALAVLRR